MFVNFILYSITITHYIPPPQKKETHTLEFIPHLLRHIVLGDKTRKGKELHPTRPPPHRRTSRKGRGVKKRVSSVRTFPPPTSTPSAGRQDPKRKRTSPNTSATSQEDIEDPDTTQVDNFDDDFSQVMQPDIDPVDLEADFPKMHVSLKAQVRAAEKAGFAIPRAMERHLASPKCKNALGFVPASACQYDSNFEEVTTEMQQL